MIGRIAILVVTLSALATAAAGSPRFEVNEDLSRRIIKGDYHRLATIIDAATKGETRIPCPLEGYTEYSCFSTARKGVAYFAAPYPAVAPDPDGRARHEDYLWLFTKRPDLDGISWVELDKVKLGERLFQRWQLLAESNTKFGCDSTGCMRYARGFSNQVNHANVVSLCEVDRDASDSTPRFCFPVATRINDEVWIRASLAKIPEGGAAQPDFTILIFLHATIDGVGMDGAVQQMLKDEPWVLSVAKRQSGLRAVSDRRTSPIVPRLRELTTVLVDVVNDKMFNQKLGFVPFLKFEFYTTLYVNDLNTSQPEDWHLPTPEVEQQYIRALRKSARTAVESACKEKYWIDDSNLTCGIPDVPARKTLRLF